MSSAQGRVRMKTVFVTASHVLSVRSCLESVCGSMVLGVSSIPLIQMGRAPHLAVFTEIRGTKIHYACHHSIKEVCAVFTRRITSRKNVKPLFLSWYYKDGSCTKAGLYYLFWTENMSAFILWMLSFWHLSNLLRTMERGQSWNWTMSCLPGNSIWKTVSTLLLPMSSTNIRAKTYFI